MTEKEGLEGSTRPPEGKASPIQTDFRVGDSNIQTTLGKIGMDIHNPVFWISAVLVVAFVLYALIFRDPATLFFNGGDGAAFGGLGLRKYLTQTFDWFFLGSANIFVIFCLFLIVSPWGKVRLGGSEAKPDFSYTGWFAMLFAAGMGIGLMFFGVLEPAYYALTPWGDQPLGIERMIAEDGSIIQENVQHVKNMSLAATSYHWGLHPWAIYAVLALALALFSYNKGLPLTIRSAFYPIFGDRVWGWVGHVIDIIAVFATLFGLATSLGFGAQQANAGLDYVFGIPTSISTQVILIIAITAVALISVVRGLEGGVKILSEVNMVIAFGLMLFVMIAAGIVGVFTDFFSGLLAYGKSIIPLSNPIGREDTGYSQGWTAFYWAWWISWSPFVGMFIARVSRGRTVREFIICVLLIPSMVCIFWMAVFGGTAIDQVVADVANSGVKQYVVDEYSPERSLFAMLAELPFASITSFVGIILVIVFFVTSSDSGSLVIDTITAGGKIDAPIPQRIFWCTFEGLVAIVLLMGGGLKSLQAMVISTGLPFTIVLLVMCVAIVQGLRKEPKY